MARTINLDTSQRVDIVCKKGDTFELQLQLKDDDGNSIVEAGDFFKMEVRTSDLSEGVATNDDVILTTEVANTNSKYIDYSMVPSEGRVTFTVSDSNMGGTTSGLYVYDIQMTDRSDSFRVTTLIYGTFKINEDVSI